MKNSLAAILLPALLAAPIFAFADSGPGCGLGQQLFAGQSGLGPHVMAATTNGTSYNQLFGLSFDSLECNANSVITAQVQRNIYVASNLDSIATDAAKGGGNHLQSLAQLMNIASEDTSAFYSMPQSQYSTLFGDSSIRPDTWLTMLDQSMLIEPQLAKYVSQ